MSAVEEIIEEPEVQPDPEVDDSAPVTLKISSAGIKAEFEGKNGRKVFKNIGLASLGKILNRDHEFDTGFLPIYGGNYMGIKRYIKTGDKEIILIEASPSRRSIKLGYSDEDLQEINNVSFPGLMMSVVCHTQRDGRLRVRDTRLFATRSAVMRESDSLCRFPLGNVYQPDGRVCWGSAERELERIKTLTQAGSLLDTFLFSAMNNDLYGNGSNNNRDSVETHLRSLQDLSDYPYSELMDEMTVKDLISLLKSKNVG